MEKCLDDWNKREPVSFYFNPDVREITMLIANEFYIIKPLGRLRVQSILKKKGSFFIHRLLKKTLMIVSQILHYFIYILASNSMSLLKSFLT